MLVFEKQAILIHNDNLNPLWTVASCPHSEYTSIRRTSNVNGIAEA